MPPDISGNAGLAMQRETAHPSAAMTHSRDLFRKHLTARSLPTQIVVLEWHDENTWIIRFDWTGGRRDRW